MNKIHLNLSVVTALGILFFFCTSLMPPNTLAADPAPKEEKDLLSPLVQRLVKDGFDPKQTQAIFAKKQVFFNPSGVSLFFIHSESSLNYDQFSAPKSIANAKTYMKTHKKALENAQNTLGVDKTIITAILLVETQLGTYLGKRTVINTLATMAALKEKALQDKIWRAIPDKKKPKRATFDKKVTKRIKWGYAELKALLRYTAREGIDPAAIKGSYAGAMGICQFMPSNALNLAKDGNQDGKVDLFNHNDAIFSVANYLKHHGWTPGISRQQQHKVLFTYNHSNYYVDAVLKVSDKLK